MADFATLASSTGYLALLAAISARDQDLAKGLDPAFSTVTTPQTNSVRFNSANKRWETYNGTTWVELIAAATDAFNITVTGIRGGNFYGSITNNGTITGGGINATTLQVAGSSVWTAASLTGLNQLSNATSAFITAAALATYAPLAAPALTGVPTAPTAAVDTNTTQLATTAYVVGQSYLKVASAATTYAPLASPALTGVPAGPTAAVDTNTTQLATTQFVIGQGYLKSATAATTYAPLGGAGASGTWGISISGTAAAAPWTGVTGKPTTLAGFGITDGITAAAAAATYAAVTGATFSGDITAYRSGAPTSGTLYLGNNSGTRYLHYDGANYYMAGASLYVSGALALTAGNFNAYAPTLTGTGASGTWPINISGSSAAVPWSGVSSPPAITGLTASSAATVNTVAQRDASGYLFATYLNQLSGNSEAGTINQVMYTNGVDNFLRKASVAQFAAALSGATMNIAGSSTSCTGNAATATSATSATTAGSATTATNLSGGSVNGTTGTFSGVVKGNSGAKGFGGITTTTVATAPTGGASGDFVMVY